MNNNFYSEDESYWQTVDYAENDWNGLSYKKNVRDPAIPDYIYREHPDAKISDPKGGKTDLFFSLVFAVILIAVGLFLFYKDSNDYAESEKFIAQAEQVHGTITNSWTHIRGTGRHRRSVRMVTYVYNYNNQEYKNTVEIGFTEAESIGITGNNYKNWNVIVYVNPNDPSESVIFHQNQYIQYLWLILVLIGLIAFFGGTRQYILRRSGRIVTYNVGKKTVMKTIRKNKR